MKLLRFESLPSTNDHLRRMADDGAEEWTMIMAGNQTGGRGRRARDWWSPEGNLHLSVLLRPESSPGLLTRLPVISALSFLAALGRLAAPLVIKWPNDILHEHRKMAGILAESRSEGDRVLWAVVGFGVNMAINDRDVPPELRGRIAGVNELDKELKPEDLALRIGEGLREWSGAMEGEGWNRAKREWSEHAMLNVPYTYRDGGRETVGIPRRLDDLGGLVMDTVDGRVTVYTGELGQKI